MNRTAIAFQSHVAVNQRTALEALLFFNACQGRVSRSIAEAIEKFGAPEIIAEYDRLRVSIQGLDDVQCLFAIEMPQGRPVGVAVYVRVDLEHISVLHLSISSEYAKGGWRANEQLLLRLLRELRRSTRRMKGVRHVELYYLEGRSHHSRPRVANHSNA